MELYPHNQNAYDALLEMLEERRRACVIQPCGTGKAMIAFHYAQEHPDEAVLWLSPNEYIFGEQGANLKHEGADDAPDNITLMTYAAAMIGARTKALEAAADIIILDEFHRVGAPEWSKGVEAILDQNPGAKVIGLTATEVRYSDGGRNMADELFAGDIASYMTLEESWLMGILPIPKYVTALYDAPEELDNVLARIKSIKSESQYAFFMSKYEKLRRAVLDAGNLDVVFSRHVPRPDAKLIVFCMNAEHLGELVGLCTDWFGKINPDIHVYRTFVGNPQGEADYRAFKEDDSGALKVLYCINQLNEGVHIKGIDGIVMVRPTCSPIVFRQQLGRALDVGGNGVPLVFDLVNNLGSAAGYATYAPSLEETYCELVRRGKTPPYTPKNFMVYDEISDPREFLAEVRTALEVRTAVEDKIARLEALCAEGAPYDKTKGVVSSLRLDYRSGRLSEEDVLRIEELGFSVVPKVIPKKRAIICYETGQLYESVAEAARELGIPSHGVLFKACKEKGVSAGFHWYFADEPKPEPHEFKQPQRIRVLCAETGELFESVSDAGRAKGILSSAISHALRTGARAGGLHWRPADSDVELPQKKEFEVGKRVVCWETGEVFENAEAAGQSVSSTRKNIQSAISRGYTAGGKHWYYEGDPRPEASALPRSRKRPVVCVETGEVFESCAQAAEAFGLTKNAVSNIVGRADRIAAGYHWRYASE